MPNPDALRAMLHNTIAPTVLRAGEAMNVVPSEATALLDGRLLPGQTGETFALELRRRIADPQIEVEVEVDLPGYEQRAQTSLFSALEAAIAAHDPGALVVPYLFPAISDSRFVVPRGVITYGFDPMKPEPGWPAPQLLAHGHDERISVENVAFGLRVLNEAIQLL